MSDPKTARPSSEIVAPESLDSQGYAVGYKKPPKASQFKPGQSGNPKGRPRSSKNFVTSFTSILEEKITLREGKRVLKVSKLEAMIRTLIHKAAQGDAKAVSQVTALLKALGKLEDPASTEGKYGVLVVAHEDEEEWQRRTAEQQRQYRER
jgi:uncharacterized protein DUF5681